jgi:hypothetical protein
MATPPRMTYLGQFERDRADRIAGILENAGIAWTYKEFGRLAKFVFIGDWGIRLFVDADRTDEVQALLQDEFSDG